MNKEKGKVLRTDGDYAWIITTKASSCEACESRSSCNMMGGGGGKEIEVKANNLVNAKEGDNVLVGFESGKLLKLTFLVYIFPIIALLAGALIGNEGAIKYGLDKSITSGLVGLLFFLLSFLFIRLQSTKMAEKESYQPKVIKIC
ncbi:MAG: SoxR reducing system RseC family protein [Desulfobacterales bacterium]|nr:SoxR reducing system RseC family protein [Desulfobacterales bacterium]MCP4164244.1 SoxR reducing system RseC family protein [Deltaproteobacteria bacterium]